MQLYSPSLCDENNNNNMLSSDQDEEGNVLLPKQHNDDSSLLAQDQIDHAEGNSDSKSASSFLLVAAADSPVADYPLT